MFEPHPLAEQTHKNLYITCTMTSGLDITLQNETRSRKVLSSNPGIRSGMGNFSYLFNCIITFLLFEKTKRHEQVAT